MKFVGFARNEKKGEILADKNVMGFGERGKGDFNSDLDLTY